MKTPLGTEVDLGPGHIVLDGTPAFRERGTAAPSFRPMSIVATVAHLSYTAELLLIMSSDLTRLTEKGTSYVQVFVSYNK